MRTLCFTLLTLIFIQAAITAEKLAIQDFSSIKIKERLGNELLEQFEDINKQDIQINLINFPDLKKHSQGKEYFEINYDKVQNFLGSVLLDLYFYDKDANQSKKYRLYAESKVYKTVFKSTRRLKAHTIIKDSDIVETRALLKSVNEGYFSKKTDIIGKQSKKIVYKDTILSNNWIESIPDIEKGEIVTIKIRNNHYEIDSRAEALESGFKGESIKIRLDLSKKIILAKIIDKNEQKDKHDKIIVLAN